MQHLDMELERVSKKHLPSEWRLVEKVGMTVFPSFGPEGPIVSEYLASIQTIKEQPDGKFYYYTFLLPSRIEDVESCLLIAMDKFKESLAGVPTKG